jgi:hypothetical protein
LAKLVRVRMMAPTAIIPTRISRRVSMEFLPWENLHSSPYSLFAERPR